MPNLNAQTLIVRARQLSKHTETRKIFITDIQALLGHQRPTTTDIYLQSIRPSLRGAMRNLEISKSLIELPYNKKRARKKSLTP
jgi:hypothetical protein